METTATKTAGNTSPGPARVGFGKRLAAYLIDMAVAGIGGWVLDRLASPSITNLFAQDMVEDDMAEAVGHVYTNVFGGTLGATVDGILLVMLLVILLEAFTGLTLGKMLLGLQDGSENGTRASRNALITRALIKYVFFGVLLLAGVTGMDSLNEIGFMLGSVVYLGFLFILGEKKQGFHDFIAKTAVYHKRDLA